MFEQLRKTKEGNARFREAGVILLGVATDSFMRRDATELGDPRVQAAIELVRLDAPGGASDREIFNALWDEGGINP